MAGSAAEVLRDWQPIVHLQHVNYQLREENAILEDQVRELLEWKERAVRHMVRLAPKRSKVQRQMREVTQMQLKLAVVEQKLQKRVMIEETAQAKADNHSALQTRIDSLESENAALQNRLDDALTKCERSRSQLQTVGDLFRVHLEKLVAVRESIDTDTASSDEQQISGNDAPSHTKTAADTAESPVSSDGDVSDSAMVSRVMLCPHLGWYSLYACAD